MKIHNYEIFILEKKHTHTHTQKKKQRTNGPVTLTWHLVLGRERDFAFFHSFKHVYIASGHGNTTTLYKGSILKFLLFPSFCISSRKITIASLFYMIFCLFHICTYGTRETTLGDNFLKEAEWSYHFDHWLHVSKNIFVLWTVSRFCKFGYFTWTVRN